MDRKLHSKFLIVVIIGFVSTIFTQCICGTGTIESLDKRNSEQLITNIKSNVLHVGGSGPGNYSSIQNAIDKANDGDKVFVYDDSSPYFENIVINVTIDLLGENANTTIINGSKGKYVVTSNSQGVKIEGFTIRNGGGLGGTGIRLTSNNNKIHDNIISGNTWYGIYVCSTSSYNTIFDSIISENDFGIWIDKGSNNFIHNCEITKNNLSIVLDRTSYNNISENDIIFNIRGMDLYYSSHNEIYKNLINGNHWGLGLYWGSINYGSSSYNLINKNIVSNNIGGIAFEGKTYGDVSYNIITENNVTNNEGGIMFRYYTSKNEVYHNNLIDNINSMINEPNNAWDFGNNNYWDNGKEGNYWDDYEEKYPFAKPRLLKPWIWNFPYKIVGNGRIKDRYPLVNEYNGTHTINSFQILSQKTINSFLQRFLENFPLLKILFNL